MEVLVRGFGKVSFACSYLPGKANIHIAFWVSLISAPVGAGRNGQV